MNTIPLFVIIFTVCFKAVSSNCFNQTIFPYVNYEDGEFLLLLHSCNGTRSLTIVDHKACWDMQNTTLEELTMKTRSEKLTASYNGITITVHSNLKISVNIVKSVEQLLEDYFRGFVKSNGNTSIRKYLVDDFMIHNITVYYYVPNDPVSVQDNNKDRKYILRNIFVGCIVIIVIVLVFVLYAKLSCRQEASYALQRTDTDPLIYENPMVTRYEKKQDPETDQFHDLEQFKSKETIESFNSTSCVQYSIKPSDEYSQVSLNMNSNSQCDEKTDTGCTVNQNHFDKGSVMERENILDSGNVTYDIQTRSVSSRSSVLESSTCSSSETSGTTEGCLNSVEIMLENRTNNGSVYM